MHNLEKTELQIGYIPLLDCVAILWAKQRGFFADAGLNVELLKAPSWARLRDRLAFGFMDAGDSAANAAGAKYQSGLHQPESIAVF